MNAKVEKKHVKGQMLNDMLILVTRYFNNKFDRGGQPYVLHCLKVMHYLKTDDEELQCIALGHDLLEDTPVTEDLLKIYGFTDRIINGIVALTKEEGDEYQDYLDRIIDNDDAILVKLCDLRHNSDIRRLKGVTEKDFERIQKYHRMYMELIKWRDRNRL